MKIRHSFVTNSSSSSFVIALRDDATKKDVLDALMEQYDSIKRNLDDFGCDDEADIKRHIKEAANQLFDVAKLQFNGTVIGGGSSSNEDDEVGFIIYNLNDFNTEKVAFSNAGY